MRVAKEHAVENTKATKEPTKIAEESEVMGTSATPENPRELSFSPDTKTTESKGALNQAPKRDKSSNLQTTARPQSPIVTKSPAVATASVHRKPKPQPTLKRKDNIKYDGDVVRDFPIGSRVTFMGSRIDELNCKIGKITCHRRKGSCADIPLRETRTCEV